MKTAVHGSLAPVRLTPREKEIMTLLSKGLFDKEIADRLGICLQTVRNILYNIYQKMNVSNRIEAMIKFNNLTEMIVNEVA
jgi:LuxR family transcriptional regulator, maltose regulon positive regulatory protein